MQIGLAVISENKQAIMDATDDCSIMKVLSDFLAAVDNIDDPIKLDGAGPKVLFVLCMRMSVALMQCAECEALLTPVHQPLMDITSLIDIARTKHENITNTLVFNLRKRVRLGVVQRLQVWLLKYVVMWDDRDAT